MKYNADDYFRFINKMGQAAMSAPYGAEIPRTALVEMLRVLTTHYDRPAAPVFVPIGRFIQRDGEWIAAASNSPTGETLYRASPSAQPPVPEAQAEPRTEAAGADSGKVPQVRLIGTACTSDPCERESQCRSAGACDSWRGRFPKDGEWPCEECGKPEKEHAGASQLCPSGSKRFFPADPDGASPSAQPSGAPEVQEPNHG